MTSHTDEQIVTPTTTSMILKPSKQKYKRRPKNREGGFITTSRIEAMCTALEFDVGMPPWGNVFKRRYPALALLTLQVYRCYNPHKTKPGYCAIPDDCWMRFFGDSKDDREFRKCMKISWFLTDGKYNKAKGEAMGFKCTSWQVQAMKEMELNSAQEGSILVDELGEPISMLHKHIARENGWLLEGVPTRIEINCKALLQGALAVQGYIHHLQAKTTSQRPTEPHVMRKYVRANFDRTLGADKAERKEALLEHLHHTLVEINFLIEVARSNKNMLPQRFSQSCAGRYFGSCFNLQNCRKIVRKLALQGLHQYDISACHHEIAAQYARKKNIAHPMLEAYLIDKQAYRETLAVMVGANVSQVKDALISMNFGAVIGPYGALYKSLGEQAYDRAMLLPEFKGLYDELKIISKQMVASSKVIDGELFNDVGLSISMEKSSHPQRAAHLFQGIESLMLRAALKVHKSVVLVLHDGWLCTQIEDKKIAEKAIEKSTGIRVNIEYEQYITDGIDQFPY